MMAASRHTAELIDRLPEVRGRYETQVPLSGMTWFRVGGPVDVLFRPADVEDLCHFLKNRPSDVPVMTVGVGSNLLVRDGGLGGVVIRLGKEFADISIDGSRLTAGAGAMDVTVAFAARDASLAGLEFLRGIPGTIGGALAMNAGAYGVEMADVLVSATAVDLQGQVHQLALTDMGFTYRHTQIDPSWIFTAATVQGKPGVRADIASRIAEIDAAREESQPLRTRTGGSTFKNPGLGGDADKAWQLIDMAGCRGLKRGGAQVSEKHCNFLLNLGDATAEDIEGLGEEVRRRVFETSGVTLAWEIKIVGRHASGEPQLLSGVPS
jgi:UDP-N-acetylmuramate dehydrogenase